MTSLLSGIRFIPKENRKGSEVSEDKLKKETHKHSSHVGPREKEQHRHKDRDKRAHKKARHNHHRRSHEESDNDEVRHPGDNKNPETIATLERRSEVRIFNGAELSDSDSDQPEPERREVQRERREVQRPIQAAMPSFQEPKSTEVDNHSVAKMLRMRLASNTSLRPAATAAAQDAPTDSRATDHTTDVHVQRLLHFQKLASIGKVDNMRMRESLEEDMDKTLANDIVRRIGKQTSGDRAGRDEDEWDDGPTTTKRPKKGSSSASSKADASSSSGSNSMVEQQMRLQAQRHSRLQSLVDKCWRCRGLRAGLLHLEQGGAHKKGSDESQIICMGEHFALRLKDPSQSIATGHCELVALSHVSSVLSLLDRDQEAAWAELRRFRSSLAALFAERGQAVMLVEAAVRLGSMPHAVVDVVPADRHVAQLDVKAGFKQSFMTCEEEWSQQRKIIELTPARPLPHAVPAHFPYLSAEMVYRSEEVRDLVNAEEGASYWGMAHAVEHDEAGGGGPDARFCLQVLAGALQPCEEDDSDYEDPLLPLRGRQQQQPRHRPGQPSSGGASAGHGTITAAVEAIKKDWQNHDWTR